MPPALRPVLLSALLAAPLGCSLPIDEPVENDHRLTGTYRAPLDERACSNETPSAAAARRAIAHVRALAGLGPLTCDDAAAGAAAGHCNYVVLNGELTHVQKPGRPGFTGVTFADRLGKARFSKEGSGEVIASFEGAPTIEHPRGFMNSVYHRAPFLRAENVAFGYGSATGCATIDFGRPKGTTPVTTLVVWPPNGAGNVPLTFHAHREVPNPVPGMTVVGSPVSLIGTDSLVSVNAALVGPEGPVDGVLRTAANDPAKLVRAAEAHFVPKKALAANSKYTATFVGRTRRGPFQITSTFVTSDGSREGFVTQGGS